MRSFFLLLFLLTANGLFAENPDITVSDARKILFAKGTDSLKPADALDALHIWAQRGDIEGQYWYAWMRHYGKGDSPRDYQESFRYFTLTAEKDLATEKHKQVVIWAIHWIGLYHGNGWGIPKDPEKCLFYLKKAADTGCAEAMYLFASYCTAGNLIPKNFVLAKEYYERAAEKGYLQGIHGLAQCYRFAWGVKRDLKKAFELYLEAADKGYAPSQYEVAMASFFERGTRRDKDLEFKYFSLAAEQGHVNATYRLGNSYYFGFGTPQDFKTALKYFYRAAEKGSPDAMMQIGFCHTRGFGVKQDYAKALKWYEKAAAKNCYGAYLQLARAYFDGKGVPVDYQKSFDYYMKMERTSPNKWIGAGEIAVFYERGLVVKQDFEKAFQYYDRGADNWEKLAAGIYLLTGRGTIKNPKRALQKFEDTVKYGKSSAGAFLAGSMYYTGKEIEKNEKKALEYLLFSANAGYVPAMKLLSKAYRKGINGQKDEAKAHNWEQKALTAPKTNRDFIGSPHL